MALLRVYVLPIKLHDRQGQLMTFIARRRFVIYPNAWLAGGGFVMHRTVWLAENTHAPALWRHDRDVNDQNVVFWSILQGQLDIFTEEKSTSKRNVNAMKGMPIKRRRYTGSRQVRIFLINTLYYFIKLQSPKLHFY